MASRDGAGAYPSTLARYEGLVAAGALRSDPNQIAVARALDRLIGEIADKRLAAKKSALGWLFAKRAPKEAVRGLYVYGGVGRGKTMLMDMFFELVPVQRKRRAHFNAFMTDVHDRVQRHREDFKAGRTKESDPVPPVALALAQEAWVLCFDEFTVTDIADAMILSRLFSHLFAEGVVLVATSNVAPDDLYRDGLNRGLFEPFIAILKRHAEVLNLDSATDYRMQKHAGLPVYVSPLGAAADATLDQAWARIVNGGESGPAAIPLKGREIVVPRASGRAARFDFADLCDAPLGARDYLALAERYDTFVIDRVPVLDQTRRNATKRFILMIDTLYDTHKRVIISADARPDELYAGRPGVTEAFEFARTASRLNEMQSEEWLAEWSAAHEEASTVA